MAGNWGMPAMAEALPEVTQVTETPAVPEVPEVPEVPVKNPQDHGWVKETPYDYNTYMQSNKEAFETSQAPVTDGAEPVTHFMGVETGDWASNAMTYEWDQDYGDIGPRVPGLEEHLFGGEHRMNAGIKFEAITTLTVTQEGTIKLEPIRRFEDAGLHPAMLENVRLAGYTVPTPIQQYCLPAVAKGYDIVACAQTGSGKTAAFLVPVLSKLMGKAKKLSAPRPNPATYVPGVTPPVRAEPLVLIVAPSRELATQIFNEARKFCYRSMLRPAVIYGGGPIAEQVASLAKGCDVLIGTPGRLIDFINRPHIMTLKRLKYMIIDEADEMLHSDWQTDLQQIMSGGDQEEGNIKYMMFSATFPKEIRELAKEHLSHDHVRIRVGRAGSSHMNIQQDIVFVEPHMKRKALEDLLLSAPPARTIIFVNSKRTADELDDYLFNKHFPCVSIHADRTQREREDCIRAFRTGKMPILIATGVSSRGLDIHNVMHVINYDLPSPQYGGIEEYTHRIGRTGRIGNMGLATSFYNERDADLASSLTKTLLETRQVVPDFLEEHIPEGFSATEGDVSKLHFDADSDNEEEAGGDSGGAGGWGAPAVDAWGGGETQNEAPVEATPATNAWGAATPTTPQVAQVAPQLTASSWGAAAQATPQVAQVTPQPTASSWGAAAQATPQVAQVTPQPTASSWGAAAQATPQVAQVTPQPTASSWGAAAQATPQVAQVTPQPTASSWGAAAQATPQLIAPRPAPIIAPPTVPVAPPTQPAVASWGTNNWNVGGGGGW